MGQSVMTRAEFQRQLFPGVNLRAMKEHNEFPLEYVRFFNVEKSEKPFEEDSSIAGTTLFTETGEAAEAVADGFTPWLNQRYDHMDFTKRVGASYQLRRDAITKFWNQRGQDLGFSARQTKEVTHASLFNLGFSELTGPDDKALFATDHPTANGPDQSNILDPGGNLSYLSYRRALTTMRKFKANDGIRRIHLMPRMLVVPPDLEYDAKEIVLSTDRPDTANRAKNVVMNSTTVEVWDYLTSVVNWFMLCDKKQTKIMSYSREDFNLDETLDKLTGTQWVIARMAYSFGQSDYLGTLGVNPS